MEYSNGWNIFKNKGINFIHLNINSLLPKIEELRFIAKSTNAAVIVICESKLHTSVLEQEISIDNSKILCCDRNRHGGAVACYIRNDLSFNILPVIPCEIENIYGDINMNLFLNDSFILKKKIILNSKSIPSDAKRYHEFCTFFGLKELIKIPARTTTSISTITDRVLARYPKRVIKSHPMWSYRYLCV